MTHKEQVLFKNPKILVAVIKRVMNGENIEQLRSRYLELINRELPSLSKQRQFPVRFNHCFARIVLDNLFDRCWYEALDRKQGAAYKQLSTEQLQQAIAIAEEIIDRPDTYIQKLNQKSLRWRNKL